MNRRAELAILSILTFSAAAMAAVVVKREIYGTETVSDSSVDAVYMPSLERVGEAVELGSATGKVQVVEFLDLQCPACALYHREVIRPFLAEIASNRLNVSFVVVHLPLPSHQFAMVAAHASECADRQGAFKAFVDSALSQQRTFASQPWVRMAIGAGVKDSIAFHDCLTEPDLPARVSAGVALAAAAGVQATPTIAVGGWLLPRPISKDQLTSLVMKLETGEKPF